MPDVPRRNWLQVHLSTAVLLMFVAGAMIWLNVKRGEITRIPSTTVPGFIELVRPYGWPFVAAKDSNVLDEKLGPEYITIDYSLAGIAMNILIALAILFAVWFVCEQWIAWRAGRKKG